MDFIRSSCAANILKSLYVVHNMLLLQPVELIQLHQSNYLRLDLVIMLVDRFRSNRSSILKVLIRSIIFSQCEVDWGISLIHRRMLVVSTKRLLDSFTTLQRCTIIVCHLLAGYCYPREGSLDHCDPKARFSLIVVHLLMSQSSSSSVLEPS